MVKARTKNYRHRVDIQRPNLVQDTTGNMVVNKAQPWITVWSGVPAAIETSNGTEFFAAQQIQSKGTVSVSFRWRPGIMTTMRLRHALGLPATGEEFFNIDAIVPDDTNRKEVVLMCTRRDADGFRSENDGG